MTSPRQSTRRLAAIMFADIMGYTALMQADEDKAHRLRHRHREVMDDRVAAHGGSVIQYYGDGALCLFDSVREAVDGAREIQSALLEEPAVPHRIGIHIGDIIQDASGIYGDGVNIASRIESLAIAGSVLFSDKIHRELENHPTIRSRSLGEFRLKNVKHPVEVFALDDPGIRVPSMDEVSSNVASRQKRNIAVLPFVCQEKNSEGEYFADGVSEEIMNGLSKVSELSVMSKATCVNLRSADDVIQVARKLNITHLLDGTVRKIGPQVRVIVQLINTSDGYQVWSEKYDGTLEDIFQLQDTIASNVVSALRVNFNLQEETQNLIEQSTSNPEAHNLYLKGLHLWNRRNPESVGKATLLFQEALTADPEYSSAQCGLSNCFAFLGSCGAMPQTEAYAKALKYAMQAIENNPKNAEAHLAIAIIKFYHYWDWEGALTSLEKAKSLGLNSSLFYQSYGLYLAITGDTARGIEMMKEGLAMDPLSIPNMTMLGTLYMFNREFDRSIATYEEVLELDPSFRGAWQYKGVAFACKGEFEKALEAFEIYHRMVNHPEKATAGLVVAHSELGNHSEANRYMDRLKARFEKEPTAAVEVDLAIAACGMGDLDAANTYLQGVYEKRFSIACMGMVWMVRCPYFNKLWKTDRYKALLKKMGLARG